MTFSNSLIFTRSTTNHKMYTTSRACVGIPNEKQYTNLQWEWYILLKYAQWQRVQCSTSIYFRKVALQSANGDRIAFPRRVAYFLNELRQPVVHIACRHICNGRVQSLYSFFKVFRGKKAAGFQSTGPHSWSILFPFLENLTRRFDFISCWFRYCIINIFLLILHTFRLPKSLERFCCGIHPDWTTTCKRWQLQQLSHLRIN